MASKRIIPTSVKNELLLRQKCANKPGNFAPGCKDYICPVWTFNNGEFDESGFQIDHIVEVSHGGSNELTNLQVLCPSCHSVKTKRCAKQNWEFNSLDIDIGRSHMDFDRPLKRKRANSN